MHFILHVKDRSRFIGKWEPRVDHEMHLCYIALYHHSL